MNKKQPTPEEERLMASIQEDMNAWTPDCVAPEDISGLAREGKDYPNAAALIRHIKDCEFCLREYTEMQQTLRLAQEVQQLRQSAEARVAPISQPLVSARRPALRFALGTAVLAAAVVVSGWIGYKTALHSQSTRLAQLEAKQRKLETELASAKGNGSTRLAQLAQEKQQETQRAEDLQKKVEQNTEEAKKNAGALKQARAKNDALTMQLASAVRSTPSTLLAKLGLTEKDLNTEGERGDNTPTLFSPIKGCVFEDRPELVWQPPDGAEECIVQLYDIKKEDRNLLPPTRLKRQQLRTIMKLPVPAPLPRGRVYEWKVVATFEDNRNPAVATARFLVLKK